MNHINLPWITFVLVVVEVLLSQAILSRRVSSAIRVKAVTIGSNGCEQPLEKTLIKNSLFYLGLNNGS